MKKPFIYIYPISARYQEQLHNPYIDRLIESFETYFTCINKQHPSHSGIFNLVRFFFETDYFYFNWIENLPDKKGGVFQTVFLLVMIPLMKISGKKIIWTIHNRFAHDKKRIRAKHWLTKILMRHSDFKITHAKEGIQFVAHTTNLKTASKVKYLPHPIVPKQQESTAHFRYDIIIWGTLSRYKGIDQFLKFLWDQNLQEKYAILIAGKIHETSYLEELTNLSSSKIEIRNKFIDEKQLSSLIFQSHIILFTYQLQTVLSSGALTDSVACGKTVIGPATGAFKDLEEYGLVSTYENFPDLITKIDRLLKQEPPKILPALKTFMRENSWEQFAENIHNWVSQQNGEKNHTSQVLSG